MTRPPPSRHATVRAVAMVVLAGALFGIGAVIARIAFDRGVPPVRLAQARVVVAFVLLVGLLAWRDRGMLRLGRDGLPALVGFGVSVAGVNVAYYIAIERLPVGVALSLQYTAPVLLLGLAALTGARRPGVLPWEAAVLTVLGAALVSRAFSGFEGVSGAGLVAGAASALFFAIYLLTAEAAGRRGLAPQTILVWGFVVALLIWTVLAPWWSWPVGLLRSSVVLSSVLGVGVVATLIPFLLVVGAVQVLSPSTAGIAATVEPPAAAAFAWVILGQRLAPLQILGAALVVMGVILAQRAAVVRSGTALAVEPTP
jgi:drug/metabolite transporter (DMT)-like permease